METRIILIVGSILLCCGCIGLVIVRLSNPFLKGLGCLGAMFASGAAGAAFLAIGSESSSDLPVLAADTLILLAFVLLHICLQQVMDCKVRLPRLGSTLLILQFFAFTVFHHLHQVRLLSVVTWESSLPCRLCKPRCSLRKHPGRECSPPPGSA
jgi:hypothetical protein